MKDITGHIISGAAQFDKYSFTRLSELLDRSYQEQDLKSEDLEFAKCEIISLQDKIRELESTIEDLRSNLLDAENERDEARVETDEAIGRADYFAEKLYEIFKISNV